MSVLRLLSKQPASGPSSSSSHTVSPDPILALHVPSYGAVMMNPPDDPLNPQNSLYSEGPRNDQILHGEFEVILPPGSSRKRCKAIRVVMRTTVKLDLPGPGRLGEEDTIFERKVEVIAGNSEGLWLQEGSQRFDFSIILPATLAPHDWHGDGDIRHRLYGELEGLPDATPLSSSLFGFRTRSPKANGHKSTRLPSSRSRSGSPHPEAHLNPSLLSDAASMSVTRQEAAFPQAPPYEEPSGNDWLKGSYNVERTIMLIYNPHPTGGVTELDERASGFAPGLGMYELRMISDVWTICALLQARLTIQDLSPAVTVFQFRISISQTHSITSPRDDAAVAIPVTSTRHFTIIEKGKRPPPGHQHPGEHAPAIWRGMEAGGKDSGDLELDLRGRVPNDDHGRPSTLPGIITPIKVSHGLITEIFFSVYGETDRSKKMPRPGPGGLRVIKITRPIILPSCAILPQIVNLPTYENIRAEAFAKDRVTAPCPLCKTAEDDRLCQTCPSTDLPHARHDHDPAVVGDERGICPMCSKDYLPTGGPGWRNCACGMDLGKLEERMKSVTLQDQVERRSLEVAVNDKEEAERGRRR